MARGDPIDTIRVRGGIGLSAPDTETMLAVCVWLGQAAEQACLAAQQVLQAREFLEQAAHRLLAQAMTIAVAPWYGLRDPTLEWLESKAAADRQRGELQNRAARAQLVSEQATSVARVLHRFAEQVGAARVALQKAIGVYEAAEAQVWGQFRSLSVGGWPLSGGKFTDWLVPAAAPFSDELIGGLSFLLAASPFGFGALIAGRSQVTIAAGLLSRVAHRLVPTGQLEIAEIVPGHGALLGCSSPMPLWQGKPCGSIQTLFTRVGDLHPYDPNAPPDGGYPDCTRTGLPKGTIAIERISRAEVNTGAGVAATTWVVLIPGTQNFKPGDHAFDGITDLDLMAGQQSQVGEQVMKALDLVGAVRGEPVVLIGHSLGGIAAVSIAASREFQAKYDLGGVITAGSPTATFAAQAGVPYLHIENDEEVVSNLDGKSGDTGLASEDRVTVTRRLSASDDEIDQAASKSLTGAHPIETHQRTLELALDSGSPATHNIVQQLETLLQGEESETRFFTGRRVVN